MQLALEILVLCVGACVTLVVLPRVPDRRRRSRVRRTASRPTDLMRIERLVTTTPTAADVHRRLRPLMREIAGARLRGRGVDLDRDRVEASALLGEPVWDVVRPDRPRPDDPRAAELTFDELAALVDRLENL